MNAAIRQRLFFVLTISVLAAPTARAGDVLETLASFNGTNGNAPWDGVALDAQGNLYGTTTSGGANDDGTVFKIAAGTGTITTLASFSSGAYNTSYAGVTLDAQGNIYGTTRLGGAHGDGTVYEIVAGSNTITTLASFNGTNGKSPTGNVTIDAQGNIYGTTGSGGANSDGTVFKIAAGTHTITTLANFNGTNGSDPAAGVTFDAQGNIYGTTRIGGSSNLGTVFEIPANTHTLTTLASFNGANGSILYGGVTLDAHGNLYGTTLGGGANSDGTVFMVAAGSNTISTLANFNGANGANPEVGVTLDAQGNIYGTTWHDGADGDGTVFMVAAGSGTISTLVNFNGTNGNEPIGGISFDASGNLYGTTAKGGANGDGTVFEIAGVAGVPEPTSLLTLAQGAALGLAALAIHARRRRRPR